MQEGEPQYEYWLRSANEERGVTEVRVQRNVHKHYDFLFKWKALHKRKRSFVSHQSVPLSLLPLQLLLLMLSADAP